MKKIKSTLLIGLISIGTSSNAAADGILISWGPSDLENMTKERFDASKAWTSAELLYKIETARAWPDVYMLLIASKQYKDDKEFIGALISQTTNSTQIEMQQTRRLIIWERVTSGELLFEGTGVQINDDLYQVAGRANWLLRNLSGKNFGNVKLHDSIEQLQLLKEKWTNWSNGKNVDEYKNPYESLEEGLDEIKSKEALEAIIISLKNSKRKEALTSDCLSKIYNLTELPNDPNAPANFCNPDTYANTYLTTLTGIKSRESFEWWSKWWAENKDRLTWNKKADMFDIAK